MAHSLTKSWVLKKMLRNCRLQFGLWNANWSTSLVEAFTLYTIEESVQSSMNPAFCAHCQTAGWGHHYVSKRKYHFVIPTRHQWDKKLEENFSDIRSHILYGLIHCNGYGHLICINGLREETDFFSGIETDVMNLWDRICSTLNPRLG